MNKHVEFVLLISLRYRCQVGNWIWISHVQKRGVDGDVHVKGIDSHEETLLVITIGA